MRLDTSPSLMSILEAALLAAGEPLPLSRLSSLFPADQQPQPDALAEALLALQSSYAERGLELVEVAGGWRLQVPPRFAPWVSRLWEEKPKRYSRAFLETLAIIAYRQPVSRADIEAVRGVAVSSELLKSLLDRQWVQQVGHKDVPGRPACYGTTDEFLNHFNLASLAQLPPLPDATALGRATHLPPWLASQNAQASHLTSAASDAETTKKEDRFYV
jgi:segregation and condensation protein B